MPTCFVIQPFDNKFDKRFEDIYKPALKQAGLDAYRVDRDPGVEVPIDTIEERIRDADICLADITTNNPNVWYELGYAFATGRSTIMVCERERHGLPFDIQHRTVIQYGSDSQSDFHELQRKITERAKVLLQKNQMRQVAESEQVAPQQGLSQIEIRVLALIAASGEPGSSTAVDHLRHSADRSGLTGVGFSLALRRLQNKQFVKLDERWVGLSDSGWDWIDGNESLFVTHRGESEPDEEDDIPF